MYTLHLSRFWSYCVLKFPNAAMLPQCCRNVAAMILQRCGNVAAMILQRCGNVDAMILQRCGKVTAKLQCNIATQLCSNYAAIILCPPRAMLHGNVAGTIRRHCAATMQHRKVTATILQLCRNEVCCYCC